MAVKPSALSIAFWNANGLSGNRNELVVFANQNELDILLISETHLKTGDPDLKIPGYRPYRTDRPLNPGERDSGGTAIYIRTH